MINQDDEWIAFEALRNGQVVRVSFYQHKKFNLKDMRIFELDRDGFKLSKKRVNLKTEIIPALENLIKMLRHAK